MCVCGVSVEPLSCTATSNCHCNPVSGAENKLRQGFGILTSCASAGPHAYINATDVGSHTNMTGSVSHPKITLMSTAKPTRKSFFHASSSSHQKYSRSKSRTRKPSASDSGVEWSLAMARPAKRKRTLLKVLHAALPEIISFAYQALDKYYAALRQAEGQDNGGGQAQAEERYTYKTSDPSSMAQLVTAPHTDTAAGGASGAHDGGGGAFC